MPGPIVAGRDERVHLTTLVHGHLSDDVSGRAKPVNSQTPSGAGHAIRAIADQPRAEQRRSMAIVVRCGQPETEPGVGDHVLRVATIDLIAGVARASAEILAFREAELAFAARPAEP